MDSLCLLPQLFNLLVSVGLLIASNSTEWQRIHWVLRLFLVENIIISISPIRKSCLVTSCKLNWFFIRNLFLYFWWTWLTSFTLKQLLHCCNLLHRVGVYYLSLFLKIKGLFVALSEWLLFWIMNFVVRIHLLRVRIPHKTVWAPSTLPSVITNFKTFN